MVGLGVTQAAKIPLIYHFNSPCRPLGDEYMLPIPGNSLHFFMEILGSSTEPGCNPCNTWRIIPVDVSDEEPW